MLFLVRRLSKPPCRSVVTRAHRLTPTGDRPSTASLLFRTLRLAGSAFPRLPPFLSPARLAASGVGAPRERVMAGRGGSDLVAQGKPPSPAESSGSIRAAQYGAQREAGVGALPQMKMLCWLQRLTGYTLVFYCVVETCGECFCRQLGLPSFVAETSPSSKGKKRIEGTCGDRLVLPPAQSEVNFEIR